MILPSDSDRVGDATFIILLKKKQNYKSTAWFMQQAADAGTSPHLERTARAQTRHSCSVPDGFLLICISRATPGKRSNKEENKIDKFKDTILIFMIGTIYRNFICLIIFLNSKINLIKYFCCSKKTDFMRYRYFHIGQRVSLKITISNFFKITCYDK